MGFEKLGTETRKEQIARAALNLVAAQGLRSLSLAAIARRVGIVPSAIYRHFKNKEEVLEAALNLIRNRFEDGLARVCAESPDSLERLRRLLAMHVEMIRENLAVPRIIFSEDYYAGRHERKAQVRQLVTDYLGRLAVIIKQGQQEGRVRPEIDAATLALMFLGIFQPAGMLWMLSDGGFDVTKHAERAWAVFRDAITAK